MNSSWFDETYSNTSRLTLFIPFLSQEVSLLQIIKQSIHNSNPPHRIETNRPPFESFHQALSIKHTTKAEYRSSINKLNTRRGINPSITPLLPIQSRRIDHHSNPLVEPYRLVVVSRPNINLLSVDSTREGSRKSSTAPYIVTLDFEK